MEQFSNFLIPILDLKLLSLVAIGTFAGIYIGAIPGLSVTMATALLLSLTYTWDTLAALALIMGIYVGGVYGGSRSAMLLNIPGAPSSIATTFDGYPLALKGEAGYGIGLATIMSAVGGLIGVLFLAFTTPFISQIAIKVSHIDYFLLGVMGLLLIGSLSKGDFTKSLFTAFFGVNIGLIGLDAITGIPILTFGSLELTTGINVVVAILGLFGFSEVLIQLTKSFRADPIKQVGKIIPKLSVLLKLLPLSLRVSVIGVLTGALPGVGGEIAALLGYDHAKRTVKKPSRKFGEGAYEGVVAPEAANNAAIGGALIPMLTLGIPGDAVTAVIIGALVIHGLNPGPMLMVNTPELFWVITGALLMANLFLLIFGLTGIRMFQKIVSVHKGILYPAITLITIIGAYSINNSVTDVYWMAFFGLLGFVFRIHQFPIAPFVLGMILGPLISKSFRGGMMAAGDDPLVFLKTFVTSPISVILTLFIILSVVLSLRNKNKMIVQ
ncbi:tripartite tricarboxylate transporter permease [Sporosarcina sp. 179-K 3D1 HS]|uniref:tripartite tricarboxylate transporter permease n=1 Tax=Sporosarcina sp. 179-K 3D1 HS TaxID=3232169 RepID=UPI0039A36C09